MQLKSSDGHIETISTTGNHPFYSVDSREFVHASKLVVGARLVGIDGRIVIVSSVKLELAPSGETFSTYNLEVEDDHTYHVGTAGVWVHNTSTDDCAKLAKKFADGAPDALENLRDALKKNPKLRDSIPKDLLEQVDKLAPKKTPIWTPTKNSSGLESALAHWKKHAQEFPEIPNATQYVRKAKDFVTNPPRGTLKKVRQNGDRLFYDPATNTFASQRADGALRTMFRPAKGIDYWNLQ